MRGSSTGRLVVGIAVVAAVGATGFVMFRPATAAGQQVTVYRSPT